jgi:hypothetical protein
MIQKNHIFHSQNSFWLQNFEIFKNKNMNAIEVTPIPASAVCPPVIASDSNIVSNVLQTQSIATSSILSISEPNTNTQIPGAPAAITHIVASSTPAAAPRNENKKSKTPKKTDESVDAKENASSAEEKNIKWNYHMELVLAKCAYKYLSNVKHGSIADAWDKISKEIKSESNFRNQNANNLNPANLTNKLERMMRKLRAKVNPANNNSGYEGELNEAEKCLRDIDELKADARQHTASAKKAAHSNALSTISETVCSSGNRSLANLFTRNSAMSAIPQRANTSDANGEEKATSSTEAPAAAVGIVAAPAAAVGVVAATGGAKATQLLPSSTFKQHVKPISFGGAGDMNALTVSMLNAINSLTESRKRKPESVVQNNQPSQQQDYFDRKANLLLFRETKRELQAQLDNNEITQEEYDYLWSNALQDLNNKPIRTAQSRTLLPTHTVHANNVPPPPHGDTGIDDATSKNVLSHNQINVYF